MLLDLQFAIRQLFKNPVFTIVTIVTLGLGIGATTAIFSVVRAVLLEPLPYTESDRLVVVWEYNVPRNRPENVAASVNFLAWRERADLFERLEAVTDIGGATLAGPDGHERTTSASVTPQFFDLLGSPAARGRTFRPDDDANVVVLSHAAWQTRFGGADVLGRNIVLDGDPLTVVGVLPPDFRAPEFAGLAGVELWTPLVLGPDAREYNGRSLLVLGRLRSDVTHAQARAEMVALATRLEDVHEYNRGWSVNVVPLYEQIVGPSRTVLLVLFGAVGFVLLLVCVNVANLLIARAAGRRQEFAIRSALGAARRRLVAQLATESLVLGAAGGVTGLVLARWGLDTLLAWAPGGVPRLDTVAIDSSLLGFTLLVSLGAALLFGLAPVLHVLREDARHTLAEAGARSTDRRARRVRTVLVAAQVALAVMLAISAGLAVKSFVRLTRVDAGFDPTGVLTLRLAPPGDTYRQDAAAVDYYGAVRERIRALPTVEAVGATARLPLDGVWIGTSFRLLDRPEPEPGDRPVADVRSVTDEYFRAMGIAQREGRDFDSRDRPGEPYAMVINETMARTFWPEQSALGKPVRVNLGDCCEGVVIGVVRDVKHRSLDHTPRSMIYLAHSQFTVRGMNLAVRAAGDPLLIAASVRQAIRDVDGSVPVYEVRTMNELIATSVARDRFVMALFSGFALLAVVLAAIGVYGIVAFSVTQRTQEIGIRVALGAAGQRVIALVVGQGMQTVVLGVAIGLVGAFGLTRLMTTLLFQVSAQDATVFATIAVLLLVIAGVACLIPARRAVRVDPVQALRQ